MNSKQTFILIFTFLYSINSYSQDNYESLFINHEELQENKLMYKNEFFSWDKLSVGVKGGINFSLIIPFDRKSVFSGQDPGGYEKDYLFPLQNRGLSLGFIIRYDITKVLKLSIQPSSNDYKYGYTTLYQWAGNTNLQIESEYNHKLRFFELPLILGVHTTYQTWQPYFQGGVYWGRILDATTETSVVETSTNLVGSEDSESYTTLANSASLYKKNQYGLVVGAGLAYQAGRTTIGLEANYRLVLSNLNTTETQFMNNQVVSGSYDVPDKFKFSNLELTLNIIVPLICRNSSTRNGSVFCN